MCRGKTQQGGDLESPLYYGRPTSKLHCSTPSGRGKRPIRLSTVCLQQDISKTTIYYCWHKLGCGGIELGKPVYCSGGPILRLFLRCRMKWVGFENTCVVAQGPTQKSVGGTLVYTGGGGLPPHRVGHQSSDTGQSTAAVRYTDNMTRHPPPIAEEIDTSCSPGH